LPAALKAARAGRSLIVPHDNGAEAALIGGATAHSATSLLQVCAFLRGAAELPVATAPAPQPDSPIDGLERIELDLADVRGQAHARRALEIAACGNHHLLLLGLINSKCIPASRMSLGP